MVQLRMNEVITSHSQLNVMGHHYAYLRESYFPPSSLYSTDRKFLLATYITSLPVLGITDSDIQYTYTSCVKKSKVVIQIDQSIISE